jgi:hypothetical protein
MDVNAGNNKSNQERYEYLVDSILRNKQVWMLQASDGSFAMFEDANGNSYVAVWPDNESAAPFTIDDWEGYIVARMGIGEFLDWMNELKADGILIGAYPNQSMQSLAIDPLDFKKQLS